MFAYKKNGKSIEQRRKKVFISKEIAIFLEIIPKKLLRFFVISLDKAPLKMVIYN
ncbi:hypothetical protein HMPREF3293_03063 [Christensenella minuta]|uniref:Uncharacterized protein n=1 Tax=Christensenella minuta TaxID=626937 RepID=A0A136Q0C8_9FIRM|nr:hypothetical protein HMPREF3293_03063 [Christensenella minuta]